MATRWQKADVWALLGLLAVGGRLAVGGLRGVDLNLGDDAHYMINGLTLNLRHLPTGGEWAVWGPLYQLWFRALWQVKHDPVVIYLTTALALGVLLPVALYFLLRRVFGVSWPFAFALAWVYALSYANWRVAPRVTLFAALWMLLGWAGVFLALQKEARWWGLAVLALGVAYIRPEFWLSSVLFFGIALGAAVRCWRRRGKACGSRKKHRTGSAVVAVSLVAVWLLWWGVPFQAGRTLYALGQHYYYNSRFCLGRPDDAALHWEDVFARDFGHPASLAGAFLHNPEAFGRHVACNLRRLPVEGGRLLTYHLPLFAEGRFWPEAAALAGLLLLGALGVLATPRGRARVRRGLGAPETLALAVWAFPVLVSVVLIYPRRHYLAMLTPLALLLYAALFLPREEGRAQPRWAWMGVAAALLLTPPFAHFFPAGKPRQPGLETVAALSAWSWNAPLRVTGTDGSGFFRLGPYLFPRPVQPVRMKASGETLAHFVETVHPDVIVVARGGVDFRDAADWPQWAQNARRWGYAQVVLPSGDAFGPWRLFIRERLMQAGP